MHGSQNRGGGGNQGRNQRSINSYFSPRQRQSMDSRDDNAAATVRNNSNNSNAVSGMTPPLQSQLQSQPSQLSSPSRTPFLHPAHSSQSSQPVHSSLRPVNHSTRSLSPIPPKAHSQLSSSNESDLFSSPPLFSEGSPSQPPFQQQQQQQQQQHHHQQYSSLRSNPSGNVGAKKTLFFSDHAGSQLQQQYSQQSQQHPRMASSQSGSQYVSHNASQQSTMMRMVASPQRGGMLPTSRERKRTREQFEHADDASSVGFDDFQQGNANQIMSPPRSTASSSSISSSSLRSAVSSPPPRQPSSLYSASAPTSPRHHKKFPSQSSPGSSSSSTPSTRLPSNRPKTGTMFQSYGTGAPNWLVNPRDKDMRDPDHIDYDAKTLFVPASERAKMTDFEKQYWDIKCDHFDSIIFYKKGKFYELYGPDAQIGKYEFDLQITDQRGIPMVGFPESTLHQRACLFVGRGYKVGIVEQLERATTKTGKGITKRKLTRVLTPGTLTMDYINDVDTRDTFDKIYLMAVVESEVEKMYGICFGDCSTGSISLGHIEDDENRTAFATAMNQIVPREIIQCPSNLSSESHSIIDNMNPRPIIEKVKETHFLGRDALLKELKSRKYFHTTENISDVELKSYLPMGLADAFEDHSERSDIALRAFSAVLKHLQSAFIDDAIVSLRHINVFDPKNPMGSTLSDYLVLDGQALTNLEIMHNMTDGSRRGTLIQWLDRTVTSFGRRLFREWLCHPLKNAERIRERQDAIEYLLKNPELMTDIRQCIKALPDLERLLAKLHTDARTVEDAVMYDSEVDEKKLRLFHSVLRAFESIQQELMTEIITDEERNNLTSSILVQLTDRTPFPLIEELETLEAENRRNRIVRYYDTSTMVRYYDSMFQKLVNKTFDVDPQNNPEFESLQQRRQQIENELDSHLEELKTELDNKNLKYSARYVDTPSKRFVIETSKVATHAKLASLGKQKSYSAVDVKKMAKKLVFRTSYIKDRLDDLEQVNDHLADIHRGLFKGVLKSFDEHYFVWKSVVDAVAELDCLVSLAMSCTGANLCRPEIVFDNEKPMLQVRGMRNVLLETRSYRNEPNDVTIGGTIDGLHQPLMVLLTGANMSGKSTLMRSVCLTVILAQLGCFVPADSCRLTPIDRIFTRIGANDRIMANESTFMVEMLETSSIMAHATQHSLVILDELGRGTATHDGYAIAYAVSKYLTSKRQCRCLFATHYHQLCRELENKKSVALYKMDHGRDDDGSIIFTYKCVPGSCEMSFGVDCAKQAGLPEEIVQLARKTSELFEKSMKKHMMHIEQLAKRVSPEKEKAFAQLVMLLHRLKNASTAEEQERAMQELSRHQAFVTTLD